MKRLIVAALCTVVLFSGCGGGSDRDIRVGGDVLRKYAFQVEGAPVVTSTTLPADFNETSWSQKAAACRDAGYDLAPYAGHDVSLIKYKLKETYSYRVFMPISTPDGIVNTNAITGELPLDLWVMTAEQGTVCGYVTVSDPSNDYLLMLAIGAFASPYMAVNDQHIR